MRRILTVGLAFFAACSDSDNRNGVSDAPPDAGSQSDAADSGSATDAPLNACLRPPPAPDLVFTDSGAVRGKAAAPSSSITAFLGIPYAAPLRVPVGFVPRLRPRAGQASVKRTPLDRSVRSARLNKVRPATQMQLWKETKIV